MSKKYKSFGDLESIVRNQRAELWSVFLSLDHASQVQFLEEKGIDFHNTYFGKYSVKRKGVILNGLMNPFTGKALFVKVNRTIRTEKLKDKDNISFSISLRGDLKMDDPNDIFVGINCCMSMVGTQKKNKAQNIKPVGIISHHSIEYVDGLPIQRKRDYEKERTDYLEAERLKYLEVQKKQKKAEALRKEAFRNAVQRNDIKNLIHFTKLDNLQSILEKGLLPISYLKGSTLKYQVNDLQRFDYMTDCTCLSVEFPNDYNLRKFKLKYPESKWVILLISPEVVCDLTCYFAKHNAATYSISHHIREQNDVSSFEGMFAQMIDFKKSDGTHEIICRQRGFKKYFTTSSQAEILVEGRIDPKYIKGVLFYEKNDLEMILANFKSDEIVMSVERDIFDTTRYLYRNFETIRRI